MLRGSIAKKTSTQQNQEFLINDTLTRDRQLIADTFNEYFTSIGSVLTKEIPTVIEETEKMLISSRKWHM